MQLSIVSTLYHSAPYLEEFVKRVSSTATQYTDEYEIVLVNDGSPDNSLELALDLAENYPNIVIVDLSRNFGHHKAMMTGLAQSKGQKVYLLDSDLEEEPEWLTEFLDIMHNTQSDVVYGVQQKRKGNFVERLTGHWFYQLFNMITGIPLPHNLVTARLMSRRYVNALLLHEEREVLIAGLWYITGFKQTASTIKKHCKEHTTYTFKKKIALLINSITSFSNAPLTGIFYLGLFISFFAFLYICFLFSHWMRTSVPVSGWTSVMASIWLLGGMIISFIGVIGIYLSKIFTETKRRPYTIIRQIYEKR